MKCLLMVILFHYHFVTGLYFKRLRDQLKYCRVTEFSVTDWTHPPQINGNFFVEKKVCPKKCGKLSWATNWRDTLQFLDFIFYANCWNVNKSSYYLLNYCILIAEKMKCIPFTYIRSRNRWTGGSANSQFSKIRLSRNLSFGIFKSKG